MDKLWDKLSSYYVFSSLVPGGIALILLHALLGAKVEMKWEEAVVVAYVLGLAFNRTGMFVLRGIAKEDIAPLYRAYRANPLDQGLYDSLMMYQTLAVAMAFVAVVVGVASTLPCLVRVQVCIGAGVAALIFLAAWHVQRGYVLQWLDRHRAD